MTAGRPEHQVFAHLTAENAPLYRAVLEALVAAKEAYRLHLRPAELWQDLQRAGTATRFTGSDQLQLSLHQLVDWGNLLATADTSEVRTVEDYYRANFLYQLSRPGEAAEAALAEFDRRLASPGALQTQALGDIAEHLAALVAQLRGTPDIGVLHQTCSQLFHRFEQLTDEARGFLGSLRRGLDLRQGGVDDFLRYKEHLIGYVERFLRELTASAGLIIQTLEAAEAAGIEGALIRAAERDLADQLRQDAEARAVAQRRWQARWRGLRAWFIGGERPAQYSELRAHTRSALTGLLQALAGVHDARLQRSDRVADLRTLARWFATAPDDAHRHALFEQAFLLGPSRHLAIDADTLAARDQQPVPPATSWLAEEPMHISPTLRATGRLRSGPGKAPVVLDHGLAKLELQRRLAAEAAALARARALVATGQATRLSAIRLADPQAFGILLDCLGAVLAEGRGDPIATSSTDGSLQILARPLPGEAPITVVGPDGDLHGPDYELTISDMWATA